MGYRLVRNFIVVAGVLAVASTAYARYMVKSGDTLSGIAMKFIGRPVWGQQGSFNRLLSLNEKFRKNPNLILVGQKIAVPDIKIEVPEEGRSLSNEIPEVAAPQETVELKPKENSFGILSVGMGFSSTRIKATETANGASSTLLTKSNIQENFNYAHQWSEDFQSSVYFGLATLNFKDPDSGGTIQHKSPNLYRFGLTSEWRLNPKLKVGAGVGMNQQLFLIGVSTSAVNLDALYIPRFQGSASYDLVQKGRFTLGLRGLLGASAPTSGNSYKTKWNPDYNGSLYILHQAYSWMTLETGVNVSYLKQNTTVASQSMTDAGVYLKLNYPFGGDSK